jgi:UDP-GlcNAc:undecaprenyl-phosphate/decaprenyl-phosphate GlcNAc-1-phosphate transferase
MMVDYNVVFQIVLGGLVSFILVFMSIPTILKVSYSKNLFDEPGKRRVHKARVPTLGGLAIFFGILFTYSFYLDWFDYRAIPYLIPSLLIIFSIGIKDDIMVTAPIMKLMGQVIAALIIVGFGDLRITDFHGFFGLRPDYFVSLAFSLLFLVFIVNGFNLIDGVDGLAAITGIVCITGFSLWFYINGEVVLPVLGAIVNGALLAFLYFNVLSKSQKIFMGDTGSLLIGFIVAVFAIRFMEYNLEPLRPALKYTMISAPAVALAILIVPVIDTIRVFFLRLSKGQSPFAADKTHIHHRLLTLGFSHIQVALLLGSVNVLFIIVSYWLRDLGTIKLLSLNMILGLAVFHLPSLAIRYRLRKMRSRKLNVRSLHK